MTLCILDSDIFNNLPEARRALMEHIHFLERNSNVRIVTNVDFQQAVSKNIDPGIRHFLFVKLQMMNRLVPIKSQDIRQEEITLSLEVFLQNRETSYELLKQLILILIQNLERYSQANEKICIASHLKTANIELGQHNYVIKKICWKVEIRNLDVLVICSLRNWQQEWTTRYSDDLPRRGSFRFCPITNWQDNNIPITRTYNGRPGWIDAFGNVWQEPDHENGHHWDLQFESRRLIDEYGLNQLNIGKFKDEQEGEIHHIPTGKQASLKHTNGWNDCP